MESDSQDNYEDSNGHAEKHGEKFAVGHVDLSDVRLAYRTGVIAMLGALVVSGVVSAVLHWASPAEPIAERVMQWTPIDIATFLLLHLQRPGLIAALLGASALLMLIGGIGGLSVALISLRWLSAVVATAAVVILLLIVFTPFDWRGPLLLTLAYGTLLLLVPKIPAFNLKVDDGPDAGHAPPGITRRQAALDTGVVLGGLGILTLSSVGAPLLFPESTKTLFRFRVPPGSGTPSIPGLTPVVTSVPQFYVNSKNLFSPRPLGWTMLIDGEVERPRTYDLTGLQYLLHTNRYVTMECVDNPVGGPLIGTALWTGVPLRHLLGRSRVTSAGTSIVMHSADGYSESVPLSTALDGAMVVFGMNGQALTPDHGYPARVLIPGLYGFKSVKWVTEIQVGSRVEEGLWQSKGWTEAAVVGTTCRIDVVRPRGAELVVAGMAFAGTQGVRGVQVRVDQGAWIEARLIGRPLSADTWRLWWARVPRRHVTLVEARAFNGFGVPQRSGSRGSFPDGATGYASRTGPF